MSDLDSISHGAQLADQLAYQAEALRQIRRELPREKGLLGFVGSPLTLYYYAVEGSHVAAARGGHGPARAEESASAGFEDGRFDGFRERLHALLVETMARQARAGAEAVAIFDSCAGEVPLEIHRRHALPALRAVIEDFRARCPETPIVYYGKGVGPDYWRALRESRVDIACLGVDWRHPLGAAFEATDGTWAVQGNFDPEKMLLPPDRLATELRAFFDGAQALPRSARAGWICGLGHGVLKDTPEANVRAFLRMQKELFA